MNSRNTAIDIMKISGATLIVLHHYQQGTGIVLRHIAFYGGKFNFGYVVELFFLISGLLTYRTFKNTDNLPTLPKFWIGKMRRILPLLTISVMVEAALRYIYLRMSGGEKVYFGLLDIIVNATGTSWGIFQVKAINQSTWYLSALMLCYLELYISIWISKKLKIQPDYPWLLLMIIGVAATTYGWKGLFIEGGIGRGMFSFFAGTMLAKHMGQVKRRKDWLLLVLPASFILLLKYFHDFVRSGAFVFYTLFIWIPIVVIAIRYIPHVKKGRIIEVLGISSFGVYIWNEPLSVIRNMLPILTDASLQTKTAMTIFVICNWIVGVCSYFLIEKPIDKVLKKLIDARSK